MVTGLDEACAALPAASTLRSERILDPELVERVETCREQVTVQKRILELEMDVPTHTRHIPMVYRLNTTARRLAWAAAPCASALLQSATPRYGRSEAFAEGECWE